MARVPQVTWATSVPSLLQIRDRTGRTVGKEAEGRTGLWAEERDQCVTWGECRANM